MITWFNNLEIQKKLILFYIGLAIIPMLFFTSYNYGRLKNILEEQSYSEMQEDMERTKSSIDRIFSEYNNVMDILYRDQQLNAYLTLDFTNVSFSELLYVDGRLTNLLANQSNITQVHFFSNNETLPGVPPYYLLDELPEESISKINEQSGRILIGQLKINGNGQYIITAERMMNYYPTGTYTSIMQVETNANAVRELMYTSREGFERFIINDEGMIIASDRDEYMGIHLAELVEGWSELEDGSEAIIDFEGEPNYCLISESAGNTRLIYLANQKLLLAEAASVSRQTAMMFLVIAAAAMVIIFLYASQFSKKVNFVLYAAARLGEGHFDYTIPEIGQDEIGQIGRAINVTNTQIQELIRNNYETKIQMQSSELNLLQEQINPHFLYNAFSVISSLSMRGGDLKTCESIKCLSEFYRISLNKGRQEMTVAQEVDLVKNYMKIQQLRFEEVEISYEVSEDILSYKTIKLILQPLVENAIHHGRKGDEEPLNIKVRIWSENNRVIYEVNDDGAGIPPEKLVDLRRSLKDHMEGYGLRNLDIRVKLNYGNDYGVTVESDYGNGTTIRVEIPKIEEEYGYAINTSQ